MSVAKKRPTTIYHYHGRSMWPIFQEGDLLEVKPVSLQELRVGDCIIYRLNNGTTIVSHRINTIVDHTLFTCGDAHPQPDDLSVTQKQLVGLIVGRFRLGSFKRVHGGAKGQLAGKFYHYAGRIDPQRDTRGGQLARQLRRQLQWLTGGLYRGGRVQQFVDAAEQSRRYWFVKQRPWARLDPEGNFWRVPWPQSLLIDPARLPQHHQE